MVAVGRVFSRMLLRGDGRIAAQWGVANRYFGSKIARGYAIANPHWICVFEEPPMGPSPLVHRNRT